MRVSNGFKSFVLDQLVELGDISPRAMFGGVGLYRAGVFFGIMAADVLYLKVDESNRQDYERAGSKPFQPYAEPLAAEDVGSGTMQYWAVPLDVLESAPELIEWARKAVAVAKKTQTISRRKAR